MSASSPDLCTRAWLPAGDFDFNVGTLDGPPTLVPSPSLLDQLQLNPLSSSALSSSGTVAVHLHAYHLSESIQIWERLRDSLPDAQLLITTDTADKQRALERHLNSCRNPGAPSAEIRLVANRGRNVLPLLQEGLPFVARYDLALHLHSKRSDAAWLNHQLNALVGDQRWCAGITELFRALPQLGLLMPRPPESLRPYLSWAGNAQHAEQLIRQLWPECEFPVQAPLVFPAGMMFWFRPQALTSLQQATQALLGLKPEPLPLDGTQLHALERLTAHACERAGFGWALVDEQAAHTNADAAANAEQIWRRPIRVWREESVAYQQGLKALSDQFRKCQGELRRLTGVEQDLRHALTTLHRDHEQQLATIHKNWEQHLAAVQTEWAQHLDTIGGYQESRGCLLHRLSRRLRRLWSANHKGRSK